MEHKTTLYLNEKILREVKKITIYNKGESITSLVNKALEEYLKTNKKKKGITNFLKAKNSISKKVFGDALLFQKKIREEWE